MCKGTCFISLFHKQTPWKCCLYLLSPFCHLLHLIPLPLGFCCHQFTETAVAKVRATYLLSNGMDTSQSLRLLCITECSVLEILSFLSFHDSSSSAPTFLPFFWSILFSFLYIFLRLKTKLALMHTVHITWEKPKPEVTRNSSEFLLL